MEILLDTNFILTCVKQKIDFVSVTDEIIDERIEWIVPFEVLRELEDISKRSGEKESDRLAAKIGVEMTRVIAAKIINVKNRNVDQGILDFARGKNIVLATMDKKLKNDFGGRILTIRDLKNLELIS